MCKFSSKRIKPIILACGFFCLGLFSPTVLAMDGGENPPQENNERRIELARVVNSCKNLEAMYKQFYSDKDIKDPNSKNLVPDLVKMKNQVTAFHLPEIYLQRINSDMYVILSKIFSLPSCLGRDATSMISTKAKKTALLLRMNPTYIAFNFTPGCGRPCEAPKTIQGWQCSLYKKAGSADSDRYILNVESAENNNDTKFDLDLLENAYSEENRNKIESLILNGPKELCGRKFTKKLLPNLKEFKSLTLEKISSIIRNSGYRKYTVFTESNLERIICPKLKSIPNDAFTDCTSLKAISLNVNRLAIAPFYGCKSLTELHFPKLRECSEFAFEGCKNLKYIHLGCNLKYETLHDDNLDIAKVSRNNPDKMLISLPDNNGAYTIGCDLTDEFVKKFNTNFSDILYNADYNKLYSIIEKSEKGISYARKKKLTQDLRKVVTLQDFCTLVVVDNDCMLKKMTNNTDYCLLGVMSDLDLRDYNSLSEDEKEYRDEEKRILSEINKQVFIDRARYDMIKNGLTNDDIINRDLLLRNLDRLLKIRLKVDRRHPAAKKLAHIWEEQERQEQLGNKEHKPLKSYKVATALGVSALGFFLFFLLLCLIKKR